MASLWPVADESTKDLMVNFYSLLKEGKASSKVEALRKAQLELAWLEALIPDKNTRHPTKKKEAIYPHPYHCGPLYHDR